MHKLFSNLKGLLSKQNNQVFLYNIIYAILLFVDIPFLNDINGGTKLKKFYINLSLVLILFNFYANRKSWKILRDPWNIE
jgi:hypothetical protein